MIAVMARELAGTPLVTGSTYCSQAAAAVAARVHDPRIMLMSGYGLIDPATVVVLPTLGEFFNRSGARAVLDQQAMFEFVLSGRFRIWIAPAQVDRVGSANISCIGPFERPKVALVGPRGLPDDGVNLPSMSYYVPRHSPRSVVEQVDHVCAPGFVEERRQGDVADGAPDLLVTNLGVFEFGEDGFRARSLHAGVSREQVEEQTPFRVAFDDSPRVTEPPSQAEIDAVEAADPLGCRRLEFASGGEVAALNEEILAEEQRLWSTFAPLRGWGAT